MIYIDSEFKCHASNPDGIFRAFDVPYFYGKCKEFIEAHRYVPENESFERSDGHIFNGEMITVWNPNSEPYAAQREYERQLIAEYEAALAESVRLSELDAAYQEGVNAAYDK